MRVAYVDTSCLVAIAFDESKGPETATQLAAYDRLYADNLLEAEFRSALAREGIDQDQDDLLSRVTWVFPAEALGEEYRTALGGGSATGSGSEACGMRDLRRATCGANRLCESRCQAAAGRISRRSDDTSVERHRAQKGASHLYRGGCTSCSTMCPCLGSPPTATRVQT